MQFSLRMLLMWTTAACCLLGVLTWFFGLVAVFIALVLCSLIGLLFVPYLAVRVVLALVEAEERRVPADVWWPMAMLGFCVLPLTALTLLMSSFLAHF